MLILTAPDCDSIAATRILVYMLRCDNIMYTTHPVANIRDVEVCFSKHCNGEIRSIVMINCGAIVDVCKTLSLRPEDNIRCFILDSHRPVHLANIHADENLVVVMDDGLLSSQENIPVRWVTFSVL